jgi:hypothetical protein
MDPNRGPEKWEPVLVVFWEIDNWNLLLSLVKGGASLTHECKENETSLTAINHIYLEGWGWDSEARLTALLTFLFLGVPFHEDMNFSWPASTIDRNYNVFKSKMVDIRHVVCWNANYEYTLNYLASRMNTFLKVKSLETIFLEPGSTSDELADDDDGDDDDFSSDYSDDTSLQHDWKFLINLKRKWMNSVALLLFQKGIAEEQIRWIFQILLFSQKS